jgi:hypothetical protein
MSVSNVTKIIVLNVGNNLPLSTIFVMTVCSTVKKYLAFYISVSKNYILVTKILVLKINISQIFETYIKMSIPNFKNIPYGDIIYFLNHHGGLVGNNPYLTAWNLLITSPGILVPVSIADWILAYNKITLDTDVIGKILSELPCNEIYPLCNLSKDIKLSCNKIIQDSIYKHTGMSFTENNSIDICNALHIGNRIYITDYVFIVGNDKKINGISIAENIIAISGGKSGYLFLRADGKVYAYRKGLGEILNENIYTEVPTIINNLDNIIQIVKTYNGAYFLDLFGNVYVEGGSGSNYYHDVTFLIKDIKQIFSNKTNTIFLDKEGNVHAIGPNANGELGLGHNLNVSSIEKSNLLKDIKEVFLNGPITTFLDKNNDVYIVGNVPSYRKYNVNKQLLIPKKLTLNFDVKKVDADMNGVYLLSTNNKLYTYSYNEELKVVEYMDSIVDVKAGNYTMLLNNKNELYVVVNRVQHKINIKGNIIIVDKQLILVNTDLYFVEVTHKIKLIKI